MADYTDINRRPDAEDDMNRRKPNVVTQRALIEADEMIDNPVPSPTSTWKTLCRN